MPKWTRERQLSIAFEKASGWFKSNKIELSSIKYSLYDDPDLMENKGDYLIVGYGRSVDTSYVGFVLEVDSQNGVVEGGEIKPYGLISHHRTASKKAKASGVSLIRIMKKMEPKDNASITLGSDNGLNKSKTSKQGVGVGSSEREKIRKAMKEMLGDSYLRAINNRVWGNDKVRRRAEKKIKERSLDRLSAGEEVIVDLVLNGESLNMTPFSKVRSSYLNFFDRVLGVGGYVMSDVQVEDLLTDIREYLAGGSCFKNGPRGTYLDGLDEYDLSTNR